MAAAVMSDPASTQPPAEPLLAVAERGIPLVERPFDLLAAEIGLTSEQVRSRLSELRDGDRPLIRRISGVFNSVAMGYQSALVGNRVRSEQLQQAGSIAARHPGVSHCYGRRCEVNLWLTLAVSPRSRLGLEGTAERLGRLCGARQVLILPTLRRYKLRVRFGDPRAVAGRDRGGEETTSRVQSPAVEAATLDLTDGVLQAVHALQAPLPLDTDRPFLRLAERRGLSQGRLLELAGRLQAAGWMRRYAAVLHHKRVGSRANAMAVWEASRSQAEAAGQAVPGLPAVSHCYLRPARPGWPYTLYAMIHGSAPQACEAVAEDLTRSVGLPRPRLLWTTREFCKRPVRLLTDDERRWEETTTDE
jgi:DNA-binding Lrp family transcriptional regulator